MRDIKPERVQKIIGIGFDEKDGHVRVTEGSDFHLRQGSEQTHEEMQQLCLQIEELVKASGKSLQEMTKEEFLALVENLA